MTWPGPQLEVGLVDQVLVPLQRRDPGVVIEEDLDRELGAGWDVGEHELALLAQGRGGAQLVELAPAQDLPVQLDLRARQQLLELLRRPGGVVVPDALVIEAPLSGERAPAAPACSPGRCRRRCARPPPRRAAHRSRGTVVVRFHELRARGIVDGARHLELARLLKGARCRAGGRVDGAGRGAAKPRLCRRRCWPATTSAGPSAPTVRLQISFLGACSPCSDPSASRGP